MANLFIRGTFKAGEYGLLLADLLPLIRRVSESSAREEAAYEQAEHEKAVPKELGYEGEAFLRNETSSKPPALCPVCDNYININESHRILLVGALGNNAAYILKESKEDYKKSREYFQNITKQDLKNMKNSKRWHCPVCTADLHSKEKRKNEHIIWKGVCGREIFLIRKQQETAGRLFGTGKEQYTLAAASAKKTVAKGKKQIDKAFRVQKGRPERTKPTKMNSSRVNYEEELFEGALESRKDVVMREVHGQSVKGPTDDSRRYPTRSNTINQNPYYGGENSMPPITSHSSKLKQRERGTDDMIGEFQRNVGDQMADTAMGYLHKELEVRTSRRPVRPEKTPHAIGGVKHTLPPYPRIPDSQVGKSSNMAGSLQQGLNVQPRPWKNRNDTRGQKSRGKANTALSLGVSAASGVTKASRASGRRGTAVKTKSGRTNGNSKFF